MATLTQIEPLSERTQWLEGRKQYIGGSECASMFNEGYGCTRRLVYEKRSIPIDYPRTPAEMQTLRRGQDLEEMVAFKFQEETGLRIRRMGTRVSKEEPRAGVNIDRQIIGVSEMQLSDYFPREFEAGIVLGPTGVLECKTANEFVFKQIERDGVPPHYVLQMQHSLAVTGYQWGIFAVLGYGPMLWKLLWFPMRRDDALCQSILKRVPKVWAIIENGSLPDPLPQPDKRCSKCEYRKTCMGARLQINIADEDKDIPADDSLAELANDYIVARQASEEAAEVVEVIAGEIKERIGTNLGALVPAAGVGFSYKTGKPPMRWDSKAIDGVVGMVEKELAGAEGDSPWLAALRNFVNAVRGCRRPGTPSRPFKFFEL